jgi:XTP/dITP diphosphohydrolase
MPKIEICFATNNLHKIKELNSLLGEDIQLLSLEAIGCTEELAETSPTIEGNSAQKAGYVYEKFGVACFADDTGLEVEVLNGAPGVYSARYAGPACKAEDNMNLLLQNLEGKPSRAARFKTVITYFDKDGNKNQFEGIVNGHIISEKRGTNGFGYDPIFIADGYEVTFAEMELSEKNKISHRALAVKKLVDFLTQKG